MTPEDLVPWPEPEPIILGSRVTVNLPISAFHGWTGTIRQVLRGGARLDMDRALPERAEGLMFFGFEVLEKEKI